MRIDVMRRTVIELCGGDIDLMRKIIILAADRLNDSDVTHVRGSGMPKQAGFCGEELVALRAMIESIGSAVEAGITLSDLSVQQDVKPLIDRNKSLIIPEN